ncbi:hypothetical protein ACJW30_02G139300 [Castanea mollissima]
MAKSPEVEHPNKAFGWAGRDTSGVLSPFNFSRRATGEKDVTFKVLYCGICHSDLHMVKNEWSMSTYPLIPGHETVGVVTEVGSRVQRSKLETRLALAAWSYYDGTTTYGGYSDTMVTDEHFVIRIPDNLPLDAGAPLLCAGITVYRPLRFYGLDKPGMHVGVVGLGGLGHVAVKPAKAMGVKVTVISTSPNKKKEALEHLGADSFLAAQGTLDGIIDTVSAQHPLMPPLGLLKTQGKLVMVGAPEKPLELPLVGGSCIGGMKETQEMIDFAAKHNITSDIEVIPIDYVNTAMERLVKADVRYRFVIDIGNTLKSSS